MAKRRFIVKADFYVFADDENDLESKCSKIEEVVNREYDGCHFQIEKEKYALGFGEIIPVKINSQQHT